MTINRKVETIIKPQLDDNVKHRVNFFSTQAKSWPALYLIKVGGVAMELPTIDKKGGKSNDMKRRLQMYQGGTAIHGRTTDEEIRDKIIEALEKDIIVSFEIIYNLQAIEEVQENFPASWGGGFTISYHRGDLHSWEHAVQDKFASRGIALPWEGSINRTNE